MIAFQDEPDPILLTIVDRFFLDADFLLGTALVSAEETAPGQLRVTRQVWKPAASLRPEAK